MIGLSCPLCRHSKEPGWLCAEHSGLPWEHSGCGAEGARCVCNPHGLVVWREVYAEGGTGERETAEVIHRMLSVAPRRPMRRLGR